MFTCRAKAQGSRSHESRWLSCWTYEEMRHYITHSGSSPRTRLFWLRRHRSDGGRSILASWRLGTQLSLGPLGCSSHGGLGDEGLWDKIHGEKIIQFSRRRNTDWPEQEIFEEHRPVLLISIDKALLKNWFFWYYFGVFGYFWSFCFRTYPRTRNRKSLKKDIILGILGDL